MKTLLFLTILIIGGIIKNNFSQTNRSLNEIVEIDYGEGWLEFRKELRLEPSSFFEMHKALFGLTEDDQMINFKTTTDNLGFTRYRFQQYHKGIKVEGAVYTIHAKENIAIKGSGLFVGNLNINVIPTISEEASINIALDYISAVKYSWEDINEENMLKKLKNDPEATYYPSPELLITLKNDSLPFDKENFVLAYKIDIKSIIPVNGVAVYVNAHNGEVIKERPLMIKAAAIAYTLYNGEQLIMTQYVPSKGYRLFDETRGNGIYTALTIGDIYNFSTYWAPNMGHYTQVHWGAEMTYDYFFTKFNKTFYDNNDTMKQIITHALLEGPSYDIFKKEIVFARFSSYPNIWPVALDIVGHEWIHALMHSLPTPIYYDDYEAGAIQESFADIFGNMIECYAEEKYDPLHSSCESFLLGEDLYIEVPGIKRSMCNPHLYGQSDTYQGTYWWEGPHNKNQYRWMGVQNKWFCLLVKGGLGTNNHPYNPYSYHVQGIGREKAEQIAYYALTEYLPSVPNFLHVRRATIEAAIDIFGQCSNEVFQTKEAWNAVGVYDNSYYFAKYVCNDHYDILSPYIYISDNIYAAGDYCPYATVHEGATVVLKATREIVLGPGFHAKEGCAFHAFICLDVPNGLKSINHSDNSENVDKLKNTSMEIDKTFEHLIIFPNPFSTTTHIKYFVDDEKQVKIEIYSLKGESIVTLIHESMHPYGEFVISFDRKQLPAGIYLCNFQTDKKNISKKIVIFD